MKSGRAFSSRPVSLSVQKKLCFALQLTINQAGAERMLPQRQHHLINDISVRRVEDDLALVLGDKGFALLGGLLHAFRHAHCDLVCVFTGKSRCMQHRAHVKGSGRVAWRAVQHVVQMPAAPASSVELALGDGLVRVILRVGHLDTEAHKRVAACLRML